MSGKSSHEHLLLINDALLVPSRAGKIRQLSVTGAGTSLRLRPSWSRSALQDAALVDLLEQLRVLPIIHVHAHEHRAGCVEGFAQGGLDLVRPINVQARCAACL